MREKPSKLENKRFLWLGKLAFPQIDTKRTSLLYVPRETHDYYIPTDTLDGMYKVETKLWGYKSRRHAITVRIGYDEIHDLLLVGGEIASITLDDEYRSGVYRFPYPQEAEQS